jgi:hypothetical protein
MVGSKLFRRMFSGRRVRKHLNNMDETLGKKGKATKLPSVDAQTLDVVDQVLSQETKKPEKKDSSKLKVLARFEWDPKNKKDLSEIRNTFDRLVSSHRVYRVTKNGKPGKQMKEFDNTVGAFMVCPPANQWEKLLSNDL